MNIYDEYRSYLIEELDDCLTIQKNNDTAYYDVLEAINDLSNDSLCVLNHLYINEGQEETFEQKFLQRNKHLKNVDGFKALRFLRPRTVMTRILKLQVADQVSTLNRITSAFVRLQYNIDTLHVTHSEQPGISNMEIQVDIQDDTSLHILIKKLKQQINVLTVECYDLVDNEA